MIIAFWVIVAFTVVSALAIRARDTLVRTLQLTAYFDGPISVLDLVPEI